MMKNLNPYPLALLLGCSLFTAACGDDDSVPEVEEENIPELITEVKLSFLPMAGTAGTLVEVMATDPDGTGPQPLATSDSIRLKGGIEYRMNIELTNGLATGEESDISAEVEEEAEEHMLFFGWTEGLFSSPDGNGNIDDRADIVNYDAAENDENGLPLGLTGTTWTPVNEEKKGSFTIKLQHQPDLDDGTVQKTTDSGSTVGDNDLDITFGIKIIPGS